MLKIYGSLLCPDCVKCLADLDRAGIQYEYCDFNKELSHLKAFLALRDSNAAFEAPRSAGKIGIPCLVDESGNVSLEWEQLLDTM